MSSELDFEDRQEVHHDIGGEVVKVSEDDWTRERKVRIRRDEWDEEAELGDSCCFGVRTVQTGRDCVWKLHGGV